MVTCPSKELKKQLIKLNFLDESKLIFLPDPIIYLKEFIDNYKISKNKFSKFGKREYFISVGRLTKQKNFEYLIDEFNLFSKKNKNIDLYIFGEGEKKNLLLKKITDYGLSGRVFLKGYSDDIYFPKNLKVKIDNIKLCHIDVNTYTDTKIIFDYVDKKIKKGVRIKT